MRFPALRSLIRRRLLVNYRVDPAVAQKLLPAPFRPLVVADSAIAGVCLIHLEHIRPSLVGPLPVGFGSQNAAHRIAVAWNDSAGNERRGVFIFRRDTESPLVQIAGGRLFPGVHHRAQIAVRETSDTLDIALTSDDRLSISLRGKGAVALPSSSCFRSLDQSSKFFEAGALGYSPSLRKDSAEGFSLEADTWEVEPFAIEDLHASFYDDSQRFPVGSTIFDHALVMRNVHAHWRVAPSIPTSTG